MLGRTVVAANPPDTSDRALPKAEILESWIRGAFSDSAHETRGSRVSGLLVHSRDNLPGCFGLDS